MLTVLLILAGAVVLLAVGELVGRVPHGVAVLLAGVYMLLEQLPMGK